MAETVINHGPIVASAVSSSSRVVTGPGRFRHDPYARVVSARHEEQQPSAAAVPCAPLDHEELANLLAFKLPPRAPSCQSGAVSAFDAKFNEWNSHHVHPAGMLRYYDDDINSERTTPYPLMQWTCVTDDADSPLHVVNAGAARASTITDASPTPGDREARSVSIPALPICGLSGGTGRGGSATTSTAAAAPPVNHPMAVLRRGGRGGSFCFGRGGGGLALITNASPQPTHMVGPVSSGETPLAHSTHTVASASPTTTASAAGRAATVLRRGGGGPSPHQLLQQARLGGQIVFTPRNSGSAPPCYVRHPSTACNSCASTPRFAGSSVWGPSDGPFTQPSTRPSPLIHASAAPHVQSPPAPHARAAFARPAVALQYNSHNNNNNNNSNIPAHPFVHPHSGGTTCASGGGLNSASSAHTAAAGTFTSSASDFILSQPASEQLGLSFAMRGASHGDALVYAMGPRVDSSPFYNDQRGMPLCITASGSFAGAANSSAAATPGLPPDLANKALPPPVHPTTISSGGVNGGASSFRSAKSCTSALRRAFELPVKAVAPTLAPDGSNVAANAHHTTAAAAFDDIPFAASPTTDGSHAPMAFAEPTAVFVDSGAAAEMTADGKEHGGSDDLFGDVDATELDRDDSLKFAAATAASAAAAAARRQAAAFGVAVAPRIMWLPGCGPSAPSTVDTHSDDEDGAASSYALPPPPPPPLLRDEILREISHCRRRSGGGSRTSHRHHQHLTGAVTPRSHDVTEMQQRRRVRRTRRQHGRREFGPCAVQLLSVEDPPALTGGTDRTDVRKLPTILSVEALRRFDVEMQRAAEVGQSDGRPMAAFAAEFSGAAAAVVRDEMRGDAESHKNTRSSSASSISSSSSVTSSSHRSWCSSVFAPETDPLHPLSVLERKTKREAALQAALGQSTPPDE